MGEINTNVGSSGINFNNNSSNSSVSAIDTQKEELNKTSTDYKNNVETETMDLETEENTLAHVTQMSKEEQVYTYETPPNYGSQADIALANVSHILNFMGVPMEKARDINEIRIGGPYENICTVKFGDNNTVEFNKNTGEILKFDMNDESYSDLDITSMTNEGLTENEQNARTFIYNKSPNYGTVADVYLVRAASLLRKIGIDCPDSSIVKEVAVSGANENIYGIRYNYGIDYTTSDFIVIDQDTGEVRRIESDGSLYTNYDGKGLTTDDPKAKDIFDESRLELIQYGGDQTSFSLSCNELLANEDIRKILTENFPDATEEDYYLYLRKIEYVGCGYVAMVNSIFDAYQGKQEEFQNTFHIPMYRLDSRGKVVFNYEPLVTSLYTYQWKDLLGYTNIEDIYGNVEEVMQNLDDDIEITGSSGTEPSYNDVFASFLKNCYGVDCEVKRIPIIPFLINEKKMFEEYAKDSQSMILSSFDFDYYSFDEETGEKGRKIYDDLSGHAMSITGVTPKGDFVVSSWGRRYVVNFKLKSRGFISVLDIDV